MRRVLIDRARTKRAARHRGGGERVDLDTIDTPAQAGEEIESAESATELSEIVEDTVTIAEEQGLSLPPASTRPMREAVPA